MALQRYREEIAINTTVRLYALTKHVRHDKLYHRNVARVASYYVLSLSCVSGYAVAVSQVYAHNDAWRHRLGQTYQRSL